MSTLFSRQDIYDYCRSVFSRDHVDIHTRPLQRGAEIILVLPGYDTPFQSCRLSEWMEVKDKEAIPLYQLYHFQVDEVTSQNGSYRYRMTPVADTKEGFPSSAGITDPVMMSWVLGSNTITWESTEKEVAYLYPLEVVIDQLNVAGHKSHLRQAEHLAGDVRERLYPTVNDTLPERLFQRDMFRYQFLRQSGHCAGAYGIPFLLCLYVMPVLSWIMVVCFIVDCYLYRKNTEKMNHITTTSIYAMAQAWQQHRIHLPQTRIAYDHWVVRSRTLLHGLKRFPLTCLNKRQQTLYMTQLNSVLETLNQDNLTDDDILSVNNAIQKVVLSYTTLAYYH